MSITAGEAATSPRTLSRVGAVLVVLLCTSIFTVAGTNARPASAFSGGGIVIPVSLTPGAASSVLGTGVTAPTFAGGALVAGAGLAGYYGTTGLLNWADDRGWLPSWLTQHGPTPNSGDLSCGANLCALVSQAVSSYGHWSPPYGDTFTGSSTACGGVCFAVYNPTQTTRYVFHEVKCRNLTTGADQAYPGGPYAYGNSVSANGYRGAASISCGSNARPSLVRAWEVPDTATDPRATTPSWEWANPVPQPVTATVVQKCRDAAGTTTTQTSTVTYAPGNAPPGVNLAACPTILPDSHRESITVTGTTPGQTTPVPLINWTLYDPATYTNYPLCAGSATACELDVKTSSGQVCTPATCPDWINKPTGGYTCWWGPYQVPLTDCHVIASYFPIIPPDPAVDPVDPVPGELGAGTTVMNPDGSTTHTQTQTMPDGTTRTVTTTTMPDGSKTITTQPLNPDGSPNGSPSVVNVPAPGTGEQTDPDGGNCMDGAFGWNPISWVYTPVKCALQWAFVPPPGSLEAAFGGVGDAWSNGAIGTFGGMLGDLFGPVGDLANMEPDGCLGPLVTIPLPVGPDLSIRPLNVCSPLAQYVLGYWMPAASAGIYLATFFGIYHGFGRALGLSTPVVRAKA